MKTEDTMIPGAHNLCQGPGSALLMVKRGLTSDVETISQERFARKNFISIFKNVLWPWYYPSRDSTKDRFPYFHHLSLGDVVSPDQRSPRKSFFFALLRPLYHLMVMLVRPFPCISFDYKSMNDCCVVFRPIVFAFQRPKFINPQQKARESLWIFNSVAKQYQ